MKYRVPFLILCLFLILSGCQKRKTTKNVKPNIILIMADDLGYEILACNGGTSYSTPNLDYMATKGVRFTKVYSMPLCTPSRVQIMTGKYNFRNYEEFGYLNPNEKTFANYLTEGGYQTAIAGKWQLGGDVNTPSNFGFEKYCLWQLKEGEYWYRYKSPSIIQDGHELVLNNPESSYGPDVFTDFILDFIKEERDEPYFVYFPMALPHAPFQPTPKNIDFMDYPVEGINDTIFFAEMVEHMDKSVGRIYNYLKESGDLNNTIIIFTGDNGTDRRIVSNFEGQKVKGDKGYTTEAGTHVPMIVVGKEKFLKGNVNTELIDFTDFLPTLLDMANIETMGNELMDGVSFYSQLTGKPQESRSYIFSDYDSKKTRLPVRRYVQDITYKLYSSGVFYNYITDPKEVKPLGLESLTKEDQNAYNKLKLALSKYD